MRYRAFDVILAGQVGLEAAVVHSYFDSEVKAKRMILDRSEREGYKRAGRYWVYKTPRQIEKDLYFMNARHIQSAIKRLLENGLLMVETEERNITGRGRSALLMYTTQIREE